MFGNAAMRVGDLKLIIVGPSACACDCDRM
jgi:hypothetical protein